MKRLKQIYHNYKPSILIQKFRDPFDRLFDPATTEEHLDETIRWLCRAQDASPDDGVSRSYNVLVHPYFKKKGWLDSYPETTGYILTTFWDYYLLTGREEIRSRALRMARWLCDIQQPGGWIQGGMISDKPTPAIFNTGQVLNGLTATYRQTKDEPILAAAVKAGQFLVLSQDADGSWKKNISVYATQTGRIYKTMVSWAMLELYKITRDHSLRDGAVRNLKFALSRQNDAGWFAENCLTDANYPFLHTIAYAVQGMLESGIILEDDQFVRSAARTADALLEKVDRRGFIPARFRSDWTSDDDWSCLTGNAQMVNVWLRLHGVEGKADYRTIAKSALHFLKSTQNLSSRNPGIRGGIKGSWPFDGLYGQYQYLNWAAKFYSDALLKEVQFKKKK